MSLHLGIVIVDCVQVNSGKKQSAIPDGTANRKILMDS